MIRGTKLTTGSRCPGRRFRCRALLEHERDDSVGRAHRDEVHDGRLRREEDGAESDHQHEEAERRDDEDDQDELAADLVGKVDVGGGLAADECLHALALVAFGIVSSPQAVDESSVSRSEGAVVGISV